MLQDRCLYHIPLPPIQFCMIIFLATASSCENQHCSRGQMGMGVPTNVTSIVGIPDITGSAQMMALLGTSHILRKVLRL